MSQVAKPSHLSGQRSLISFCLPIPLTRLATKVDANLIPKWRLSDLSGEASPSHRQV